MGVPVTFEKGFKLLPVASGKGYVSLLALDFEGFDGLLGPGSIVRKVVLEGALGGHGCGLVEERWDIETMSMVLKGR